jgi:acetyltransferase-like isoleucine patch superfamily enzyme
MGDMPHAAVRTTVRVPSDDGQIAIGRHSYYHGNPFVLHSDADRIEVGAFCGIALGASILGGGEQPTDLPSSYPLRTLLTRHDGVNWDVSPASPTRIGNDVRIGHGALVLSGVTIGDGAVIAAGAVVSDDVPPYGVAGGNPAQLIGHRFDERTIERLLAVRWWDWPDERILAAEDDFYGDVERFLAMAEALDAAA